MRVGEKELENKVLIVAEIGNNHEGSIDLAKELVRRAADCGVDAVKFQTFRAKYFVNRRDEARYAQLASFELPYPHFQELRSLAKSLGLLFLSTPLDLESAEFLEGVVDAYKIASGDINFYPLIERVCRTGKPVIFSSGASDFDQVLRTKRFIEEAWRSSGIKQEVAVLHCVSSYPVLPEQANLATIPFLKQQLGGMVGYSDHTMGVEACVIATALGAQIIEKHFTLDKSFSDFRDHRLSADPQEMKQLVEAVARTKTLLGVPGKMVQESETEAAALIRRSIVAASDLPAGHRLSKKDLTWIRPGGGVPPGEEDRLLSRTLKHPVQFGDRITTWDVE